MLTLVNKLSTLSVRTWLEITAAAALVERFILWLFYSPVSTNDTPSYFFLAKSLRNHGFTNYNGTRTPGYPAFLLLTQTEERTYLAQLLLGLAITLLFFYIGWRLSGKGWVGALAASAYTLNLGQLFFEAAMLTETLTTFFIALAAASVACLITAPLERRALWWAMAGISSLAGIAGALAAMVRPMFVFMPLWIGLFLLLGWRAALHRVHWASALSTVLPALLIIGAWMNFIHQNFKVWSMDAITGYHLVNHTGWYFEYVPDEYARLRDTYIQYREAQIAATGSQTNAIWEAIPAMQKASGRGFYGLSRLLTKISVQLILEHPDLYLRNVIKGWWWCWFAPIYWSEQAVTNPVLLAALRGVILAERVGLVTGNIIFVLGSLVVVACKQARRFVGMNPFLWFIMVFIWLTSLVQALPEHGDNRRYLVSVQAFIVLVVLLWVVEAVKKIWARKAVA